MSVPNQEIDPNFLSAMIALGRINHLANNGRFTTIGTGPDVLAERVLIKREVDSSIYLHTWKRSDPDDRHDHPWDWCSIIIDVGYWEVTDNDRRWRPPGDVQFRKATERHRVELSTDPEVHMGRDPVSLFITGPIKRKWGFHTPEGFIIGSKYRGVDEYRKRRDGTGS